MSRKKSDIVPVYLFTGFLESGKTKFIKTTLEDEKFCKGERTLLILCEEGEEEYSPEKFHDKDTFIEVIEDESQLTEENLRALAERIKPERVVAEYNGMWMLDSLYDNMPQNWMIYQEFMFADAGSFLSYNSNLRPLVYDKLKSADLCVFNRFRDDLDKMAFHKIVRGASKRADIAYEFSDDRIEYDDIEDPLPFDLDAPIVEIGDMDYAEWYRDISEDTEKYDGKTVRFKGRCLQRKKTPRGSFLVGRHIMTCCEADIEFAPFQCRWDKAGSIKDDTWMILTAKVSYKFSLLYGRKGPVLKFIDGEACEPPKEQVATFY